MACPPGCGQEQEAEKEDAVAMAGNRFPGTGLKVVEGCEGETSEEAVEAAIGGKIDITVIGWSKAFVIRVLQVRGDEMVPAEEPGGKSDNKKGGQQPDGFPVRFYGGEADDEER
jgi:hypothetical protein